jgi:hypothetical protein
MTRYVDTYVDDSQFKRGLQNGQDPASILGNFKPLLSVLTEQRKAGLTAAIKNFTPAVDIRQTLYNRYAFDEIRVYSDGSPMYLLELAAHRLHAQSGARDQSPEVHSNMATAHRSGSGHELNSESDRSADTKQVNSVARRDKETDKDVRRKATLSQLSPVEMLQLPR